MEKPRSLEMPTMFGLSLQTGMRLETRNLFSCLLENKMTSEYSVLRKLKKLEISTMLL